MTELRDDVGMFLGIVEAALPMRQGYLLLPAYQPITTKWSVEVSIKPAPMEVVTVEWATWCDGGAYRWLLKLIDGRERLPRAMGVHMVGATC